MGLPVFTCSSPSTLMISVPDAGMLPRIPGTEVSRINLSITDGGNPFGYVGNAWSKMIPAISQCPVVVSLPLERSAHRPYEPRSWSNGGTPCSGRIFPRPYRCRLGSRTVRDSRIWPRVSAPASPHSGASGIAPIPAPSRTISSTRWKLLERGMQEAIVSERNNRRAHGLPLCLLFHALQV